MSASTTPTAEEMSAFLPPVNRAMRTLDRAFFKKTIPLTAAHIFDAKYITKFRKDCAKDVLRLPRTKTIINDKDAQGNSRKLLLLRPGVKVDDLSTAQEKTREYISNKIIELLPYTLHMTYGDWSYYDIMSSILPEDLMEEVPQSFAQAGHLAHLNLRSQYSDYKHLIASVIIDKNPRITTVINKTEDVGTESEFRTFPMEVLAGEPNTEVEVNESGCIFRFDFAKVYWNTRLGEEHERVFSQFKSGEAVCDVMAGVGPFAIPAGKRRVFVWANDLNPESYKSMVENIKRNKAELFVTPFCTDGRAFINTSAHELLALSRSPNNSVTIEPPAPRSRMSSKAPTGPPPEPVVVPVPSTFSHYVMNLPATAITFLDAFRGVYRGLETLFEGREMPMIHVYCFHKSPEPERAPGDICRDISKAMGYEVTPESLVNLEHVRVVSPNKVYYCVSFRLPREVAFAEGGVERVGEASTGGS